ENVADVIDTAVVAGHYVQQLGRETGSLITAFPSRRVRPGAGREVLQVLLHHVEGRGVIRRHVVNQTAGDRDRRATELELVHLLPDRVPHDGRSGGEDAA